MTTNVKMILDEVNARIKLAEAKTAEDPSNFDSFPGAESEKPVPAEAKKPDPEVKDEGPASRTEVAGAEPGSDAKVLNNHLYEADEPVLNPNKQPLDSDDAFADTTNNEVSKTAADILNIIKNNIKEKRAENATMSLNGNILNKIASVQAARQQGAADALALIKMAQEQAAQEEVEDAAQSEAAGAAAADEALADAAAEEQGAADADAAVADAAAADEAAEAPEGVTPDEVVQAVSDLVEEGQISEEEGAEVINNIVAGVAGEAEGAEDEAPVDEEELAQGIADAIENGDLTEEEAQQLVTELVSAGADEELPEDLADAQEAAPEEQGAADAEAAIADAAEGAASEEQGAADADAAVAAAAQEAAANDATEEKTAEAISRYQTGFLQKCAEYGVDPSATAAYLQARMTGRF